MTKSLNKSVLQRLLDRDVETVMAYERRAWDEAVGGREMPLVLFGAGGMGRRTLAGLRELGIEPVAFADNNPANWHKRVNGITVLPVPEAAARYGSDAAFVVTIWGGHSTERMSQRVGQLRALGCRTVVSFGPLFWKYPRVFLPHYSFDLPHKVFEQRADVLAVYDLWADDASRSEYLSQVRWRTDLDFEGLAEPVAHELYFPEDLIAVRDDERFVDCGAFDGDTLKAFYQRQGTKFSAYAAFEPDPLNFARLQAFAASLPPAVAARVTARPCAVGDKPGTIRFGTTGTSASSVGTGDLEVQCVALDEELAGWGPTYVKMDIEGSEPDALAGFARTISASAPFLAVCAYHLQDHLWRIPLMVRAMSDRYRFYLRPHLREVWDLVCYAVPVDRLIER